MSSTSIPKDLLHELSLAESLVLHPQNREGDWSVTSGAYFVTEQDREHVRLSYNPHFLTEIDIKTVDITNGFKEKIGIDVRKRPTYSVAEDVETLSKNYDVIWRGNASIIHYFYFNPQHPLVKDKNRRKAFARLVHEAFIDLPYKDILKHEQFIPNGYTGGLKKTPIFSDANLRSFQDDSLLIFLDKYMVGLFPDLLTASFERYQIPLKLFFIDQQKTKEFQEKEIFFAQADCFIGNQRDPLSSWRFLYGEGGRLHLFYPQVKHLFEALASATGDTRKTLLQELHKLTLEEVYAIPFAAERDAMLASDRVDLSNINPFDMRLRYFEMKWKR
jgi:ABC-type oligopeptide transport system substrate-binding subunit